MHHESDKSCIGRQKFYEIYFTEKNENITGERGLAASSPLNVKIHLSEDSSLILSWRTLLSPLPPSLVRYKRVEHAGVKSANNRCHCKHRGFDFRFNSLGASAERIWFAVATLSQTAACSTI